MKALALGITTDQIFDLIEKLRKDTNEPILLMLYINLVYRYGCEKFVDKCLEAGVDDLIIPDLLFEEIEEVKKYTRNRGIYLINLIAPTTNERRLERIVGKSEGFIYCVSSLGVTGARNKITTDLEEFYNRIRKNQPAFSFRL